MTNKHPTESQIRARAYEIFVLRGCHHGHEMDDWLQAEYELMQLPLDKVAKLKPTPTAEMGESRKSLVGLVRAAMFLV
jgi:hypothetical protein